MSGSPASGTNGVPFSPDDVFSLAQADLTGADTQDTYREPPPVEEQRRALMNPDLSSNWSTYLEGKETKPASPPRHQTLSQETKRGKVQAAGSHGRPT